MLQKIFARLYALVIYPDSYNRFVYVKLIQIILQPVRFVFWLGDFCNDDFFAVHIYIINIEFESGLAKIFCNIYYQF